jgi:hypothetical protein
LKINLATT